MCIVGKYTECIADEQISKVYKTKNFVLSHLTSK